MTMAAVAGLLLSAGAAQAAVGDLLRTLEVPSEAPGYTNHCSIGLAFDGTQIYYNRCNDGNIYRMSTSDADADGDAELLGSFPSGIPERPNAMAFDALRNGLWIGTQTSNAQGDMPVYFYSFASGSATQQFVIPDTLTNPATGSTFVGFRFVDGLAYDAGDPTTASDDAIWWGDDVNRNFGKFSLTGSLIQGYDATTVSPALSPRSGIAVGGPLLYLANNGGGVVFRTDKSANPLGAGQQFAAAQERLEDMECDDVTFPVEAIWIRHTPQSNPTHDLFTANEIEPGTCSPGGGALPEPVPGPYKESCGLTINGKSEVGTAGADTISGTPLSDEISGAAGNDRIEGLEGDDCLFGNRDKDTITGDDGNDVIAAGRNKDTAKGNGGDDVIKLQDGADKGKGGPGDDTIKAQGKKRHEGGIDKVSCGSGDDKATVDRWDVVDEDCEKVKVVN
jgi:hypothetical protein